MLAVGVMIAASWFVGCRSQDADVGPAGDGASDGAGDGVSDGAGDGASDGVVTVTTLPVRSAPAATAPAPAASPEPGAVSSADADDIADDLRIVPVDGDLAEIVFALGLGDQVVATDISATYPQAADALPEIGYQRALAAEPIMAFEPTIVLATDIAGPTETLDALERLGVEVAMIPNDSVASGPGDKIRTVAAALGVGARGDRLADAVDAEIDAATARAVGVDDAPRVAVLYLRGQNVQLLFGEGSGVDWLIEAAGGVDIADELGVVDNAPINAEALLRAAPDVLVIPTRGLESVGGIDGLLELPGIAETPAGQQRRILTYDDQFLLGNGPRTGAFLDQFITDLHGDIP